MILAGDIGGTNTRLAFFEFKDRRPSMVSEEIYASRDHRNLEEIVGIFLAPSAYDITSACFGIAGPVRDGKARAANLPWVIDTSPLAKQIGNVEVTLINDLEANAWGLGALDEKEFVVLNEGSPAAEGNEAIISAGTGLGEAGLHYTRGLRLPFASEGGHSDFAPRDDLQVELLKYLMAETGHVSNERLLSGPGLVNIYRFLRDTGRYEEPGWLKEQMGVEDPAALISSMAQANRSELCVRTLNAFVSIYGAETGNLALRMLATGGVFLGGGIAPKIVDSLRSPIFMEAFVDKGRMRSMLEAIPVRVIMNTRTALLGAAMRAASGYSNGNGLGQSKQNSENHL